MAHALNASLWTTTLTLAVAQAAGQSRDFLSTVAADDLSAGSATTIPGVDWEPVLLGRAHGMVINDACETAMLGFATQSDEEGAVPAVWARTPAGDLTLVAAAGEPAFGLARFGEDFSRLAVQPDGTVTFSVSLVYDHLSTPHPFAHFRFADGVLTPIAMNGQPLDTGDDVLLSLLHEPAWEVAGNEMGSAFFTGLDSTHLAAGNRAILTQTGDAPPELLVREGDTPVMEIPGTSYFVLGGVSPVDGMSRHLAMNSYGETVFSAVIHDALTDTFGAGIWIDRRLTGLERIARSGDTVADGVTFEHFDPRVTLNFAGIAGFIASLEGPGVDAFNNEGAWVVYSDGVLRELVRKGDEAPGALPGSVFHRFDELSLADNCATVVKGVATLGEGFEAQHGFWSICRYGGVTPIAMTGGPAFDMEEGVTITGFVGHAFGDRGHVAFVATVDGIGVEHGVNDLGLWQTDDFGRPVLVARTGFGLEYTNGVTEPTPVVTSLTLDSVSRGDDGLPSAVNRLGDTVFTVGFADGTGNTLVATPPEVNHADVNRDGLVTAADFSAWILAFNTKGPGCDQNGDGACAPDDFSAWILNFNAGVDA